MLEQKNITEALDYLGRLVHEASEIAKTLGGFDDSDGIRKTLIEMATTLVQLIMNMILASRPTGDFLDGEMPALIVPQLTNDSQIDEEAEKHAKDETPGGDIFDKEAFSNSYRGKEDADNLGRAIRECINLLNAGQTPVIAKVAKDYGIEKMALYYQLKKLGLTYLTKQKISEATTMAEKPDGVNSDEISGSESLDATNNGELAQGLYAEGASGNRVPDASKASAPFLLGEPQRISRMGMKAVTDEIEGLVAKIGLGSDVHNIVCAKFMSLIVEKEKYMSDRFPIDEVDNDKSIPEGEYRLLRAMHRLLYIMATRQEKFGLNKLEDMIASAFWVSSSDAKKIASVVSILG